MANKNPNAGKPGYDKYGAKTMAQRRKEKAQAAKDKIQKERAAKAKAFGEANDKRNRDVKSRAQSRKQVERIKTTMGLNKPKPQKTASQKKREKVTALEKPKVSGVNEVKKTKASASKNINTNKKPSSKYFSDPNISNREKRIAKRVEKRKGRQDDRAERIALRKDITFDQAKELQGQRKAGRKQFLKNFAANLAGVEMNKGEFNTKDYENYKKSNAENSETNIVSDQQKSNNIETESNAKNYKSLFEAMAATPNSTLGDMSSYTDIEV